MALRAWIRKLTHGRTNRRDWRRVGERWRAMPAKLSLTALEDRAIPAVGIPFAAAQLTPVDSALYFTSSSPIPGLWRTDPLTQTATLIRSGSGMFNLTAVGSTLYFSASEPATGRELWKTDGTIAGTQLVGDINPGSSSSNPSSFCVVGSTLYFSATDNVHGNELWRTDVTTSAPSMIADIMPGAASSSPQSIAAVGSRIYFSANIPSLGVELAAFDGVVGNPVYYADILSGSRSSSPSALTAVDGKLFFGAQYSDHPLVSPMPELFVADGLGISLITDHTQITGVNNFGGARRMLALGSQAFIVASGGLFDGLTHLFASDGSAGGTLKVFGSCLASTPQLAFAGRTGFEEFR